MSEIDASEVRRIAELARLELDDREVERFARDLEEILSHFRELGRLDLEEEEGPEGRELEPHLRADVPDADPLAHGPGETAPDWRDGFFVVPRLAALDADRDGGG